ncbi:Phosphoesterase PA-phosphatase related protein [Hyphomicrobium sp. GJ21]|jgi:lipid A 4'-phosphatase|uniref:phosphatase PAP2 family protein n=1 Tax=Hyphomicrobium sp. GJ21 TaxID=113574 RepID=UPI000622BD62|nr:phosphatase PAP2 family protein [Hyphomicrobium sp. GJ21]CEJ84174.1 Phosphoesterase PA-phosphatase related protein [Hyphomicrobium sp. GJ21]
MQMDNGCHRCFLVASRMLVGSIVIGCIAAAVFSYYPNLDLVVAEKFHTSGRRFIGMDSLVLQSIRIAFNGLFIVVCAVAAVGSYYSRARGSWSGLIFCEWNFLLVCILAGPLVVTNLGFKDHWGRARPRDVLELGGKHGYTPPLRPAHECAKNCSFVSGEASSIFTIGFAATILFPLEAALLLPLSIAFGSLAGLVRMMEGGHFLSDVVFAGIFSANTTALVFFALKMFGCLRQNP